MATTHVAGTELELKAPKIPLTRPFLVTIGILFLLAMHFFMPNPGGAGLALAFNPTTWLVVSFSIAIGLYQLGSYGSLRYNKLTIGLFVCCIMLTLPVLYSGSNLELSLGKLTGLWTGYILFVVLQQFRFSNKQKQRLLWFITIAVFIEAMFGWVQYLTLEPGNFFGYNTDSNRPYGIFQQPNVMASFLATGLALSGYLLTRHPTKYQRKVSEVALLYLMPVATVPLLVVLASRTGWLAAVLSIALLIPYVFRFATKKRFVGWIVAIIVGTGLGFSTPLMTGQDDSLVEQKSNLESPRRYTFPQALDMLIEKPFTGYGYGRFEPEYMVYTARQHQLNPSYKPGLAAMDHPHNELLYWGVEGGLLPLLAIILAALFVLARLYQAKKGTRLAMFALFVPIVLHSQLEYPFYHSAIHWITFVILLYWVDQRASSYRQAPFSIISKTALRVSSLVIPIVTSFYMLTTLHTNYVLTQFERSQPKDPDILNQVTNPVVWKDRYDWDIYSTYLNIGLYKQDPQFIQPYIDWSLKIIKDKPRPAFYNNLILAYQGLGDSVKAEQIRSEAQFLFPEQDFSEVQYIPPNIDALKADSEKETN
ncbi:PglL family O-oligosaccharyltransferase [Vibrio tubiashii]|uniref:Ligase n=1 Tax=Vibrio tubiashii ATCC 19109 TaxID=1051646 RepID=F9TAJ4_9VIBR|nr:PglL family O-oligosaccharyltransferase [Vibrio tubiashii]AIW15163.1 ligase [Vibrio tubiashii ATCC 19109]EGU49939.1 SyrB [Vibrio tubiashii ATCC 19109]EIF02836.1 SyrB [Vibrio tubiashii NCIMB 1337 = ATCC 19106]